MSDIESQLRAWDGESVHLSFDPTSGAWIVIAVHSTAAGPATGGTRLKPYPDLAAAVKDALHLAESMTYKFAVTGFPRGGGKAVLAVPPDLGEERRRGLLRHYGCVLRQLGGLFEAGTDVGTSPADMEIVAETGAPHVFCRPPESGGSGDPAIATALGVFCGLQVVAEQLFGSPSLQGRAVLVQGAGSVGYRLIARLRQAGARVMVSDLSRQALHRAEGLGAANVPAEAMYDTPCDIFSPCALGGVLNEATIARMRCRAVAGSANNQLAGPEDAERLRRRGILYAPDFVISLGGALAGTGMEVMGWSRQEADDRVVEAIGGALRAIFARAGQEGITTVAAAYQLARQNLHKEVG